MKRIGSTYQEVYSWENLMEAWLRAKKGSSHTPEAVLYSLNLHCNLKRLQESLTAENPPVGNYHYFMIHDPKERRNCAASFEERILHHAVMRVLEQRFEQHFMNDTYACRKGKGTEKAILKAFRNTKNCQWYLKLDMKTYFDTIDHDILKQKLQRIIKDQRMLNILEQIISSYCVQPGKGIPIGNLTSQFFANFYLSFFDHFVKEQLRVKQYVRYMDDCVLWGSSKQEVKEWRAKAEHYLAAELQLKLKYAVLNTTENGVPFLGFLIKPDCIHLLRSKKRRVYRTCKLLYQELCFRTITQNNFAERITASLSHLKVARSQQVVYDILQRYDHRLEPGSPGRQLEQQCAERPFGKS